MLLTLLFLTNTTTLWCHYGTRFGSITGRAYDASLDRRADGGVSRDIVCQHLVHDVLGGTTRINIRVPIPTRRHEIVLGNGVSGSGCQVNWKS
jgi:hypothetical protein